MVTFLRIDVVAARRLDSDGNMAEPTDRQRETARFRIEIGIGLLRAPAFRYLVAHLLRQRFEECAIVRNWQSLPDFAPVPCRIGRPGHQMAHQRVAIVWDRIGSVA